MTHPGRSIAAAIAFGAALLALSGPGAAQEPDTEPPSISAPANRTAFTGSAATATVTWPAPFASDNVGVTSLGCAPASGSAFNVGVTTVTCTARDAADNRAVASFTVTVIDNWAPQFISTPANRTAFTGSAATATVTWPAPTAADNVGVTSLGCAPASGSAFNVGVTTVTCTARDAAGNTGEDSFTVTVIDNWSPTITVPANITRTLPPGAASMEVSWADPVASDNIGVTSLTCTRTSGTVLAPGIYATTCTARDAAGNQATGSFTVTVIDAEAPTVTAPAPITVPTDAGVATAQVRWPAPEATDNVGVVEVLCDPASGSRFPLGSSSVTCTARDAAGNEDRARFSVEVVDREAPEVIVPGDRLLTLGSGETSTTVTWPDPTATDNVGVASLVCDPAAGSTFEVGSSTVTCTAVDAAGNIGEARFEVILGTTAPAIPALIDAIGGAGLRPSVADSLVRPLEDALALFTDDRSRNDVRGCQKLDRFQAVLARKETRARVDPTLARRWNAEAEAIGRAFGC
jgi:alpha-D-ribose 1-methylphosphonate 5-triphosphate synthase subunit PhnG